MREFFHAVFNVPVSEGSLVQFVSEMAAAATSPSEAIRQRVAQASCLGSDETGLRVKQHQAWVWTWQTPTETFLGVSPSRGSKAVTTFSPQGFPHAVRVHDRWRAQRNTPARSHQLCLAHVLRDLQYGVAVSRRALAWRLQQVLRKAIALATRMAPDSPHRPNACGHLEQTLDHLLAQCPPAHHREGGRLLKALRKHRDKLFVFLTEPNVPPTTNAREQALRNSNVKQHVSMSFRTWHGAKPFVKLRTILDTCLKRKRDIFSVFQLMGEVCLSSE